MDAIRAFDKGGLFVVRSKARDISSHSQVTRLGAGSPLVFTLPANSKRRKDLVCDFSSAQLLGRMANILADCFVEAVEGMAWGSANAVYAGVRPFLADLALVGPLSFDEWTKAQWESYVNGYIVHKQASAATADGTKNFYRQQVHTLFRVVWRRQLVPAFKLVEPIKNPISKKKIDLASITPAPALLTEDLTPDQRKIVTRLSELSDITNPKIHSERLGIMLTLLRKHAEDAIRETWAAFNKARSYLDDSRGIDVENFIRRYQVGANPLKFKRGWQSELTSERDVIRFLCHPDIFENALFAGGQNCVKKWLNELHGLRRIRGMLHPTIDTVVPFVTLFMVDLNNEVSSAARMKFSRIQDLENPNVAEIAWEKGRSGEEQSVTREKGSAAALGLESDQPITVYQAAKALRLYSGALHLRMAEDQDNMFMVSEAQNGAQVIIPLNEEEFSRYFHRFRRRHPILRHFEFSGDKVRGSVILQEQLKHNDIFRTAQTARHKSLANTKKYIDTISASHANVISIRELQDVLLLASLPDDENLRQRLGMDRSRAKALAERAGESGFLEWHLLPGARRPQSAESKQTQFMEWLTSGEKVFLESADVAAELIAFKHHLESEADVLRAAGEWWTFGAPTLIVLSMALSQMRPDIRLDGEKLAREHQIEYLENF